MIIGSVIEYRKMQPFNIERVSEGCPICAKEEVVFLQETEKDVFYQCFHCDTIWCFCSSKQDYIIYHNSFMDIAKLTINSI